jgi:hypothetical protein
MVLHFKSKTAYRKAMAFEHIHPEVLSGRFQEVVINGKLHHVKHR